jgi:hypothetical protein
MPSSSCYASFHPSLLLSSSIRGELVGDVSVDEDEGSPCCECRAHHQLSCLVLSDLYRLPASNHHPLLLRATPSCQC